MQSVVRRRLSVSESASIYGQHSRRLFKGKDFTESAVVDSTASATVSKAMGGVSIHR